MTSPADCSICCPAGWSPNIDQVPDEDCPTHGRPKSVCYSRERGQRCRLCDHKLCESCPDCSPEVPD